MDPGAARFSLLPVMSILLLQPEAQAADGPPNGCGASILPLYYKLCDLSAVWGVVVEALAAAGVVLSFVLLVVLLASLPFMTDRQRQSSVGIQAGFLLCTMGLFGLAFAFVVGRDFVTCMARQLLFGVLFAGCFACLLMQSVRLNLLARRDNGPPGWVLCLGALGLWLVEAIINVEWLVLTMLFPSANSTTDVPVPVPVPCPTSNQDFSMALIYVMALLLTSLIGAVSALIGKRRQWLKECTFLLATTSISLAIWVVWLTMYIHGNDGNGNSSWEDPTLAITLVFNAWVFLTLSSVPQICMLTEDHTSKPGCGASLYSNTEVTVKEQKAIGVSRTPYQNLYMENKAFSMDEPSPGRRPISPYSNYNSCIYQPTALALITKGPPNKELSYDALKARVTANPQALSRSLSAAPQIQTLPGIGPINTGTVG